MSGPFTGEELVVPAPEYVIGRDMISLVTMLHDPDMSREHAKFTYNQGHWSVADLGSRNGTVVDGTPIGTSPVPVWEGTTIGIGSSVLRAGGAVPLPPDTFDQPKIRVTPPPIMTRSWHPSGDQLSDALKAFRHGADMLSLDGRFTPAEAGELIHIQNQLGLSDKDTHEIRAQTYVRLINQAMQESNPELIRLVRDLRSLLGFQIVGHPAVTTAAAQAAVYFANSALAQGVMPTVPTPCMAMMAREACHLEVEATWLDAKTDGSVSYGLLVLTSQRMAFFGSPTSFGVGWGDILAVDFESAGLVLHSTYNPDEPARVMYSDATVSEVVQRVCEPYAP